MRLTHTFRQTGPKEEQQGSGQRRLHWQAMIQFSRNRFRDTKRQMLKLTMKWVGAPETGPQKEPVCRFAANRQKWWDAKLRGLRCFPLRQPDRRILCIRNCAKEVKHV